MRHAACIPVALLCASVALTAQDQFERQVRTQIAEVGNALRSKGYELTHQVHTGRLDEEASEMVTLRLKRGVRYALLAVCDQDCGDLDLRLYDPADREIGRDVERDDTPVIEVQPDKNGEYTVRIEMAGCKDEPCAYGIGVFATEQDAFERQVRAQLEKGARSLGREGFQLTHHIYTGGLREDEAENVVFELDRGNTYLIVGVCDNDCKDLDLRLTNSSGREIDTDVGADDYPVVAATPNRRERYTVRATMAQCGASPCRYGIGVFAK